MSTGPKKVEPILYVGPLTERRPRLAHQVLDSRRLALQGEDLLYKEKTCSARMRLALQGKEVRPHYYKKPQHPPHKKVRVTDSSLTLQSCKKTSNLTFGGCLAGSTPVPPVRCFWCCSLLQATATSAGIVHLTGELLGIIRYYSQQDGYITQNSRRISSVSATPDVSLYQYPTCELEAIHRNCTLVALVTHFIKPHYNYRY